MLYSAPLKYLLKVGGEVLTTTAQTLSGAVNELKTALSSLATVARTGSYNDLLDLPTLAVVATSNNYNDLDNRPTFGTAASKDVPASGNADNSQVVLGNDSRLTDARTPTSHTHTKSQITDFGHTHNYAGSDSAGGPAHSAAYANLLKYIHTNEINFKGGAQTNCWFNYRNADTDAASAVSAIVYKFGNYSNDVSKTTLDAAAFTGTAANANKLQGYTSDTAKTANTIVRRDGNGYIYAQYYNQASGSETATSGSYVMFCNSDGWLRKTPMSTIKSLVDTNTNTWRGFQFQSRTSGSQTIANNAVATFTFSGLNNVSGYAPRFAWYSGNNSTNKIIPCRAGSPCGDGTCSFVVFNLSGAQKTGVTITIYVLYTQ